MPRIRPAYRAVLLIAATVSPSFAQKTPDTQDVQGLHRRGEQVPLLRSYGRLVSLDVVVIDNKGATVQGLKASDFTVEEDGKPQYISGFEEHTRPDEAQSAKLLAAAKLPPNTFTDAPSPIPESSSIVFVLDVLDSPGVRDQMYRRQEMLAYMKSVPPGTRIAIVLLDEKFRLIQGFSSNPEELLQAVESKRDFPELSGPADAPCSSRAEANAPDITHAGGWTGVPSFAQGGCGGATQVIAVPAKGNYFLRLGIHDTLDDTLGILEVPIDDIKLNLPPNPAAITFQH